MFTRWFERRVAYAIVRRQLPEPLIDRSAGACPYELVEASQAAVRDWRVWWAVLTLNLPLLGILVWKALLQSGTAYLEWRAGLAVYLILLSLWIIHSPTHKKVLRDYAEELENFRRSALQIPFQKLRSMTTGALAVRVRYVLSCLGCNIACRQQRWGGREAVDPSSDLIREKQSCDIYLAKCEFKKVFDLCARRGLVDPKEGWEPFFPKT